MAEDMIDEQLKQALDVVGNKWSALILYYLHKNGPTRFVDCQRAGDINPRTLTQRLNSLEKAGLVRKKLYNEYPPRSEYDLTEKGETLIPVLESMVEWAKKGDKGGRC